MCSIIVDFPGYVHIYDSHDNDIKIVMSVDLIWLALISLRLTFRQFNTFMTLSKKLREKSR